MLVISPLVTKQKPVLEVLCPYYRRALLNCVFIFPGHGPGVVTLQVACEGYVISNTCSFEYKTKPVAVGADTQKDWFNETGMLAEQEQGSMLGI